MTTTGIPKTINILRVNDDKHRISFVYKGQAVDNTCSTVVSSSDIEEQKGLPTTGTGSQTQPYAITEPDAPTPPATEAEHFACFQVQIQPGGESFEGDANFDCSTTSLTFANGTASHAVGWANPTHNPVVYAGVSDSDTQDFDKVLPHTNPVASWSDQTDGLCVSDSNSLLAFAKTPYDARPDPNARGFKIDFSKLRSVGRNYVLTGAKHFYIPKTVQDAAAPATKSIRLVYLGASSEPNCEAVANPAVTMLKVKQYACFQAQLEIQLENDNTEAARATQNLELALTTSSTGVPSEYVAATSGTDYGAAQFFDTLSNSIQPNSFSIARGDSRSGRVSIEVKSTEPGAGNKWFKVTLAKRGDNDWSDGVQMSSNAAQLTQGIVIVPELNPALPALAFRAIGYVDGGENGDASVAAAKCSHAGDRSRVRDDITSAQNGAVVSGVTVIADGAKSTLNPRKAEVSEGRFVCAQAVYLTFNARANAQDDNCYKVSSSGGCWVQASAPAGGLTSIQLKNLFENSREPNAAGDVAGESFSADNNKHDYKVSNGEQSPSSSLAIAANKGVSNIFVIEIKKNKDDRVVGVGHEVLAAGLEHASMRDRQSPNRPASLQFLSSTKFDIQIPYSPDSANNNDPGYDGDTIPAPAVSMQETKLMPVEGREAVVQLQFQGRSNLPSRATGQGQHQYNIQICARDAVNGGAPERPDVGDECWRTAATNNNQPTSGPVCTSIASSAAPTANIGKLVKTGGSSPYTFTCAVAALAGKYYFFRVQDVGDSGAADDSAFAYSRAVSVPAAPDKSDVFPPHGEGSDPSPIMARKVGSGSSLGIELSWKCPAAAHRKWTCNDGAVPRELRIAENLDNADNDDIVDYQVWRCKMRNVNKVSTWAQTDSKRWNATKRGAKSPSSDFEDTYTKEDGMVCEDFFGWLAEGETRLPPGGAVWVAPDYGWPPNYDGYWAGIPAEKSYLMKMIWGDLRFGGAYADVISIAGRTLLNAASRATAPKLHTEFKVANGKIIFTDRSSNVPFTERRERSGDTPAVAASEGGPEKGFSHGRYKYRIRAITKLGAPVDAYCDGRGATMRDRLEGSAQACTSMPTASGKAADFGTSPLGLVAKGQPKPTNVSVERIEGDDTKLKLTWLGRTPLIQIEGGKTSTKTDDKFLHVYALRHCATDNHGDSCSSFNAICNAPPRGNNGLVSCPGGARPRDSQRDQTKKLASEDAFDSETDSNKVFSAHALHIKSSCTDDADELARDSNKVRCNISDIASSSPYKFGCIVSGLDKTKYHRFRVAEQETTEPCVSVSGEGASSDWATTEPTLTTKPSLGVISAAKVTVGTGDAAKEGIQLSWACPPTSHRKWACGGSTKTALNMTGASGQGAPDDDDIVDYHIYRCKMRDTNANGDYTDTTDDHTYNDSDDMSCQPLMNYDGYVVQESDTPGTPTEAQLATARASVNKLVWGDTRFGGAYADGTTTLTNAALKAADSERATCATFETVQDDAQDANTKRILFTDTCGLLSGGNLPNDGLAPGRYHYLVKAIKSGNLPAAEVASAQCGGVADTSSDPVATSLSDTAQECATSNGQSHNHNGLSIGDSFNYNMGTVQVQQNTNNKIQLSWTCPAAAQRDWDCAGGSSGTSVGTSGNDEGYLLDSDRDGNDVRDNPNKVGRYKIYRCMQGSGEAATRCSANTDWMSASPPDYVKTSYKVSFSSGANPKMLFVDDNAAWRAVDDTTSTNGASVDIKYIYKVVPENEFGVAATDGNKKLAKARRVYAIQWGARQPIVQKLERALACMIDLLFTT